MSTEQWAQAFNHSHQALQGAHSHALNLPLQPYQQQALSGLQQAALQGQLNQLPVGIGMQRAFDVFEAEFKMIREALKEFGIDRGVLDQLLKEVRELRAELRDAVTQPAPTPCVGSPAFPANALKYSR